ncbi:MAG: response regulator [Blastocatellia bacterium]|nr:response regulator [Blastocatellia bacterium]
MKVLVVDDEPISRCILVKRLEIMGHEPVEASGGEAAFQLYLDQDLRVILCDWEMPEIDGLALCRRIRTHPGSGYPYFILLTGVHTSSAKFDEAMNTGVDDFLTKPVDPLMLQTRIRVAERICTFQTRIQSLEQLLPLCMYCKKYRDQAGHWHRIETYLAQEHGTEVSHGICPDCLLQARAELGLQ